MCAMCVYQGELKIMVLKKISVHGFKSFADRLNVEFEEGMTGIVGPNGCGKSNVADAIRWVLGEQSAKTLRGSNMQDVIFNGTSVRKSMSYCEVSLIFDNEKHIFPVEYEEVTVTRKLYRSGDSEYLLNNQTCRLKDITDLLHDTGVSKEGYSIIGQGNVERIFNSRPEERRSIFEDAVGISKFKARKNESERKLVRTRDNLEKLNYIIADLEERIGPLERQSANAKKYFELRESLRYNEVNSYLYQFENSSETKKRIREKLDGINEEYNLAEAEFAGADSEYNKKTIEQNNIDVLINKLKDEQMQIAVNAKELEGQGNLIAQRLEYYKAEKERLEEEIKETQESQDAVSQQLLKLVEQNEGYKKIISDSRAEYAVNESEYLALIDEINRKENEIEERNRALIEKMSKLSDVKADISELQARLDALKERQEETALTIAENRRAIEQEEQVKAQLEKELSELTERKNKIAGKYNAAVQKNAEIKNAINSSNNDLRELSNGIGAVEAKLRILKEYKENFEAYNNSVRSLLQAGAKRPDVASHIDAVVAEVIKTPKELETAIETALGGALQNIITNDEDDAKYLIELLRRERLGRVTFLPLSSAKERARDAAFEGYARERGCLGIASQLIDYDRKYSGLMSSLLGRTLIFSDIDSAIAASKKSGYAYKIVTVEGDVFVRGSITGGSKKSESADLLKQDRAIETTAQNLEKYNAAYESKSKLIKDLEALLEENSAKIDSLTNQLKDVEVEFATARERLEKSVIKTDDGIAVLERLNGTQSMLEEKIEEYNLRLSVAGKQGEELGGKDASKIDVKAKDIFSDKKALRDSISEKMTALKVRIAAYEKERDAAENNIARLKAECEDYSQFILENRAALNINQSKINGAEEQLRMAASAEENSGKIKEILEKIKEATEYKQQLQNDILTANATKDRLAKSLQVITEKRAKERAEAEKIDSILNAMEQRIAEEYSLTYDTALEFKDEQFDNSGAASEITRLKREISRLGNVNTGAIEEYQAVSTKYAEYKEQADDLIKAEADLMQIIAELSQEMIERFETEFNKINENFKIIFKDLFGGGTGNLVLDKDCEDPLEAGIEIMAQPPSKNLRNISLLSGGEKTLTAIAILFAILRLRPLPFCLLDEVEAALDDSNAAMVAKYIKKYSNETQFILITHRKPTMEICDRLYGVTMEEKGVSKMVAVRLSDAVKQAETK